jgi:hypothetical protein
MSTPISSRSDETKEVPEQSVPATTIGELRPPTSRAIPGFFLWFTETNQPVQVLTLRKVAQIEPREDGARL